MTELDKLIKAAQVVVDEFNFMKNESDNAELFAAIEDLSQAVEQAKAVEAVGWLDVGSFSEHENMRGYVTHKQANSKQSRIYTTPPSIYALIAEIDAIPREGEVDYDGIFMMERDDGEYLSFDAVMAAVDKYRARGNE